MNIFTLLRNSPKSSVSEIALAIADATKQLDAARKEYGSAAQTYEDSLLDESADASIAAQSRLTRAQVGVDRAERLLETLHARHEEAKARDTEESRRKRYEAAKRAKTAMVKKLPVAYLDAAKPVLALLRELSEVEAQIAEANAERPQGEEQIAGVERTVRGLPFHTEEVIGEEIVEKWMPAGAVFMQFAPYASWLSDDQAKQIRRTGPRTGLLVQGSKSISVELRRFKRIQFIEAQGWPGVFRSLAGSISLPSLCCWADEEQVWSRFDNGDPAGVLERVKRAEQLLAAPQPVDPRGPRGTDHRYLEIKEDPVSPDQESAA